MQHQRVYLVFAATVYWWRYSGKLICKSLHVISLEKCTFDAATFQEQAASSEKQNGSDRVSCYSNVVEQKSVADAVSEWCDQSNFKIKREKYCHSEHHKTYVKIIKL